ncbi:Y381-like protein, partial [Mya arenaria]
LSLNKSIDVSKVLLQNGADVQQVMQMQGREVLLTTPPLIHAVETDNLFLASILLEHGEDVNQGYGACSHSPIHFAIIRSNSDMVKLLIQYGANLNKRNGRGTTPLALGHKCDVLGNIQLPGESVEVMRNPELKALLYDYVSQPHSLQHLCRYGIRGHLAQTHGGRTIIPAVMSLPLPPPLKSFLALNTTS